MDLVAPDESLFERPYLVTEYGGIPLILWLKNYNDEEIDSEVFQAFIIAGLSEEGIPSMDDKLILGGDSNKGTGMLVFSRSDNT